MREYARMCEDWYRYNASLKEPLLGPHEGRCRCLPRHGPQRCPHPIDAATEAAEAAEAAAAGAEAAASAVH